VNTKKNNNKALNTEFFYFSTLILIFIVLCFVFFGHQGHVLVDCGREVYFPEQVLKGKVLFKDIFILFGPLSYQINAFLYQIFGIHINTLYFAGIANSFIILTVYYLIARKLTSIKVSWLACFLLMGMCIFYYYVPNYIFPYSYAMIYALSAFLISVLFCIHYIEKTKPVFLILSALFMGISAASKVDFVLFFFVLLSIAVYFKPVKSKRSLVFFILAFLSVPLISLGIEVFKGLRINDLLSYYQVMQDFVDSFFFKYFYQEHTGLYPTPLVLGGVIKVFTMFLLNFSLIFIVFYTFFWLFSKLEDSWPKKIIQVICFIFLYIIFPKDLFKDLATVISLAWLPISTTIILLLCYKDRNLAIVAIAGIIASLKSYFFINLNIFGTFLVPLLILVNLVFIFDKVPEYLKFIPKKIWEEACFTAIFIIGLVFLLTNIDFAVKFHKLPIETSKGKIYTAERWGTNLNSLVNYINNNIPEDKTFVMMPEGIMLNFLTNRESDSWFHSFTPHFVDVYGEDNIIRHLSNKKPDYIFITNQDTKDFYYSYFCQDYAKNICQYIHKNYTYLERLEKPRHEEEFIWVDVYRRK